MTEDRRGWGTVTLSILGLLIAKLYIAIGSAANITTLNTTTIDPGNQAYVPFEIWAIAFGIALLFMVWSLMGWKGYQFVSFISVILSGAMAWLSGFIEFHQVETVTFADGNTSVIPISTLYQPTWISYIFLAFFVVSIIIAVANMYDYYIARQPEWKQDRYYNRRR